MANVNTTQVRLNVAGGSGAYQYSVVSAESNIPATITVDGILTVDATAVSPGTYSVKVKIQDSTTTITPSIPVRVGEKGSLEVKTLGIEALTNEVPTVHKTTLVAGGGTPPYTWAIEDTNIKGASVNDSGEVTLPITAYGTFSLNVSAKDSTGKKTPNRNIRVAIMPGKPYKLEDGKVELYLSGSDPLTTGTRNFTVKVKDAKGDTKSQTYYFSVQPPITPFRVRDFSIGKPAQRSEAGQMILPMFGLDNSDISIPAQSQGPYMGMMGSWDNVAKAVVITAPPTTFGTKPANFSLSLEKSGNKIGNLRRNIGIAAINSLSDWGNSAMVELPILQAGVPMQINPLKPYPNSADWVKGQWTVSVKKDSSLPPGVSLDSMTGLLYGLPTEKFSKKSVLVYSNGNSQTGEVTLNWNIVKNDFISSLGLSEQVVLGQEVDGKFIIGAGNEISSIVALSDVGFSGMIPFKGYQIAQEQDGWHLRGKVQEAGEMVFGFELTSKTGGKSYIIHKMMSRYQDPLVITNTSLPTITSNKNYEARLNAYGGAGLPYRWTMTGNPPAGIVLSEAGVLSGQTSLLTYDQSLKFKVTDSQGGSQEATLRLKIVNDIVIDTQTLPVVKSTNTPYTATLQASGGSGSYKWSATNLPNGFTLDQNTGVLTHPNPSAISTSLDVQIAVSVTDGTLSAGPKSLRLWLNNGFTDIKLTQTEGGNEVTSGCPWRATIKVAPGATAVAPYTWRMSGAPSGLTLDAQQANNYCVITGATKMSDVGASKTLNITLTDGAGSSGSFSLQITAKKSIKFVNFPTLLPPGRVGIDYSLDLSRYAYSCNSPITWKCLSGMPSGMVMNTNGSISGKPTGVSTAIMTFQITDSEGSTETLDGISMVVSASTLGISTTSLPVANVGSNYSFTIQANGGSPAYTYFLAPSSAPLPAGWTLNSSSGALQCNKVVKFNSVNLVFGVRDSSGVEAFSGALSLNSVSSMKVAPVTTSLHNGFPYLGILTESRNSTNNPNSFLINLVGVSPSANLPSRIDSDNQNFWFERLNGTSYCLRSNLPRTDLGDAIPITIQPSIGGDSTSATLYVDHTKSSHEGVSSNTTYYLAEDNPTQIVGIVPDLWTPRSIGSPSTAISADLGRINTILCDGPVGQAPLKTRPASSDLINLETAPGMKWFICAKYNGGSFRSPAPFSLWGVAPHLIGNINKNGEYTYADPVWNGSLFSNGNSIEHVVYPVLKPVATAIGPNLINDGQQKTLTISLARPIPSDPPVSCKMSCNSLTTITPEGTPVKNASGEITAFDFKVTLPPTLSGSVKGIYSLSTQTSKYPVIIGGQKTNNVVLQWTGGNKDWPNEITVSTGDKPPKAVMMTLNPAPSVATPDHILPSKAVWDQYTYINGGFCVLCEGWVEQKDIKTVVFSAYDSKGNVVCTSADKGSVTIDYPATASWSTTPPAGYNTIYSAKWFIHSGTLGFPWDGKVTFGAVVTDNTNNSATIRWNSSMVNCSPEKSQFGAWAIVSGSGSGGTQGGYYEGWLGEIVNHNNQPNSYDQAAGFNGSINVTVFPENFCPSSASSFTKAELWGPSGRYNMNQSVLLETASSLEDQKLDLNGTIPPNTWVNGWGDRPKDIPASGFSFSIYAENYLPDRRDPRYKDRYDPYEDRFAIPSFTIKFFTNSGGVSSDAHLRIPMGYGRGLAGHLA